jgi:hypothetical protein
MKTYKSWNLTFLAIYITDPVNLFNLCPIVLMDLPGYKNTGNKNENSPNLHNPVQSRGNGSTIVYGKYAQTKKAPQGHNSVKESRVSINKPYCWKVS